jgi:hypothetical protein
LQFFGPILLLTLVKHRALASRTGLGGWIILGILLSSSAVAWLDLEQARFHARPEGWEPTPLQSVHYLVFTFNGTLALLALVGLAFLNNGFTRSVDGFLMGWLLSVLVFNVACTPFNAVRHLLLAMVPMTWLVSRCEAFRDASLLRTGVLLCSTLLGVTLAAADFQFAESARQVARRDVQPLVAQRNAGGRNVWYTGNWGFVYYAQSVGAHPWIINPQQFGLPRIQPGDLVVHPVLLTWTDLSKPLPAGFQLKWIKHWQPMAEQGMWPTEWLGQLFRTISPGVNYYSVRHYALPWEFLLRPADEIERAKGVWLTVPTLGDYRVYEVISKP